MPVVNVPGRRRFVVAMSSRLGRVVMMPVPGRSGVMMRALGRRGWAVMPPLGWRGCVAGRFVNPMVSG